MLKNLGVNFVIASAYFFIGMLSLLADPLGILMLSSGLGLASVLLLGFRVLPGIALGSFCVSAWTFDFNENFLGIYFSTAVGVSLGALVGVVLIRKSVGFPNSLVDGKSIAIFMFFGGLVGSIFPATFVVIAMQYLKVIATADCLIVWLSFWVGNVLGVLIFTPLCLIAFAQPENIWRRRKVTVALPIVSTFALIIILFLYLKEVDRKLYTEQLKEKAGTISEAIKHRFDVSIFSIVGLKNFLLNTTDIQADEFAALTQKTLQPLIEVQALVWANLANLNSADNSVIKVFDRHGNYERQLRPSVLLWLKKQFEASKNITNAGLFYSDDRVGYIIFPIDKKINPIDHSWPVLIAVISIETLVNNSLIVANTDNCMVTISGINGTLKRDITFYAHEDKINGSPYETLTINILDQKWRLDFYHNWVASSLEARWPFGWVMFFGLCFTGLLGSILLYLTGRYFCTEAIIEERAKVLTEMKTAAEQANQAKNHFLAKISHELRTPLNGILGFIQLLEKRPSIDREEKKLISIIKQCSDTLLKLINDILDISAIESRQTKIEICEFNLKKIINESINICKFKADAKGLDFILKDNCKEAEFLGDEKRIRQILVNLLDNAVKYTNKGKITIITHYQDGNLFITVEDTGCGITPEHIQQIFSPFVQVNADNFSQEGIGLGLSISKELVNLMNGELTVKSHEGVGSAFTVSLPLAINVKASVNNQESILKNDRKQDQIKVLLVDDNKINLLFMNGMLEHIGCNVDSAKDGLEALVLVEQNSYDLALIDINMPIINGVELAKRLKLQNCRFPLVAVSAYADEDKINMAVEAGFDSYLTKPVEESQLKGLIQKLFC